ncbi:hypothetical protein QCB45_09550 [Thiomicrorhabdus sp. ZW0627]|uniref:hypothetical protein n=1 Tax=Thiomicrorhabdus sp. ZW0627 TaxID=3039774 RepID=UPI002436311A|nr:hypothetical protein [Thiomicrorhabdus sp. ZW0627]MDG6774577.1 hypothetical protein [Thiomicrorhabdus sp. ZW0627]
MKRAKGVSSSVFLTLSAAAAMFLSGLAWTSPSYAEDVAETSVQASQDENFLYESIEVNVGSDKQAALETAQQQIREAFKKAFIRPYEPDRSQPVLERAIRQEVVSQLPEVTLPDVAFEQTQAAVNEMEGKVFLQGRISKAAAAQEMALRMAEIEAKLSQLRHMGDKNSRLKQLKLLLPNLPLIEEYARLAANLTTIGITLETDKTPMAVLLDRKITILFNEFLLMLDDSIPEAVVYEAEFADALEQQGLLISAKQPDLILKYNIETTGEYSEDKQLGLAAEVDLQDKNQESFVTYSADMEVGKTLTPEIQYNALQLFAKGVFEALKSRLLQTVYEKDNQPSD